MGQQRPKRLDLRSQLLAEPPDTGRGSEKWYVTIRRENPALMEELDKIIDDWNKGDAALRSVKRYKATLAKWIKAKAGVRRNIQAIVAYIDERANGLS